MKKLQRAADITTVLASWKRAYPGSETLKARLTELRSDPATRGLIADPKLVAVGGLFRGRPEMNPDSPRSLARAKQISRLYLTHFNHAGPFDRGVLRAAWENCTVKGCGRAQGQIERHLGKIDVRRRGDVMRRNPGAGRPTSNEPIESADGSQPPAGS